jgi:hypothetical protein
MLVLLSNAATRCDKFPFLTPVPLQSVLQQRWHELGGGAPVHACAEASVPQCFA